MIDKIGSFLRSHPGRGVLLTFLVAIVLPGLLLAAINVRSLLQERRLVDQQIRDSVRREADDHIRSLEAALLELQRAVEALPATIDSAVQLELAISEFPEEMRSAGAEAILIANRNGLISYPPGSLLYQPIGNGSLAPGEVSEELRAAELFEREGNDDEAIRRYKELIELAPKSDQPAILNRLGRTYRRANRLADAIATYEELRILGDRRIGPLSTELIALYQLCSIWEQQGDLEQLSVGAMELYRNLVDGRWQIEKVRYEHYIGEAHRWLDSLPDIGLRADVDRLDVIASRKLDLTEAVETFASSPQPVIATKSTIYLAFWREFPFAALLVSENFLRERIWPRVFGAAEAGAFEVALKAPGGATLFGVLPDSAHDSRVGNLSVTRRPERMSLPLEVVVFPRNTEQLYAEFGNRQNLYIAMIATVIAMLVFGSFFTVRLVRRELQVAQLRSDFVSTVSHELRSPLTGIRQLGEMLMHGRVRSEARAQDYYRMIVQECERLTRLIGNVLDFSRFEAGKADFQFESLNPAVWLTELVSGFNDRISDESPTVRLEVSEAIPNLVADCEALSTAVVNLLDNAVKYAPVSKTIELKAVAADGALTISVEDHGPGISAENQAHLFKKFYRGQDQQARSTRGVGLGLSLVRQIAAAHGGTVFVESVLGMGSTFSIRLPVSPESERT